MPFSGLHCETTATGSLLKSLGIELSEAMLFGIGEGLGYIYWDMKQMSFPFIGGRIKPDTLTFNIARNLGLDLKVTETSSQKIAWKTVTHRIDEGIPTGLKLDSYYLDYFSHKVHFPAHYVAMYGYDETDVYLIDTIAQGSIVKTSIESLAQARNSKGPMSSKNLSYTITKKGAIPDLAEVIPGVLQRNALDFCNPPIQNIGYKGIEKTSKAIKKWFSRSTNIETDLNLVALLMEEGGTGGSLFRNFYRDFLKECLTLCDHQAIQNAYDQFREIAPLWKEVAILIKNAGETREISNLHEASDILLQISQKEYDAMKQLSTIV